MGVAAAHEDTGRAVFGFAMGCTSRGVAVASSVYAATRSRRRAFVVAAATSLLNLGCWVVRRRIIAVPVAGGAELALLSVAGAMIAVSLLGSYVGVARRARPGAGGLGGWWVLRIGLTGGRRTRGVATWRWRVV